MTRKQKYGNCLFHRNYAGVHSQKKKKKLGLHFGESLTLTYSAKHQTLLLNLSVIYSQSSLEVLSHCHQSWAEVSEGFGGVWEPHQVEVLSFCLVFVYKWSSGPLNRSRRWCSPAEEGEGRREGRPGGGGPLCAPHRCEVNGHWSSSTDGTVLSNSPAEEPKVNVETPAVLLLSCSCALEYKLELPDRSGQTER